MKDKINKRINQLAKNKYIKIGIKIIIVKHL